MPLWGSLVGACFGRRSFGKATGLMSPIMLPIQILGIPFAGWVFDRTGSYDRAFQTFVLVYLGSMVALILLRLPNSRSEGDLD